MPAAARSTQQLVEVIYVVGAPASSGTVAYANVFFVGIGLGL